MLKNTNNNIAISIPFYFNITILSKNQWLIIYFNNKSKFCCLWLMKKNVHFSKNAGGFILKLSNKNTNENTQYIEHCTNILIKSWNFFFFKKFKFKSKGLKIKRKKKKYLKFFFWLSHTHIVKIKNCKLRRLGKQKYVFICSNWEYLTKVCKRVRKIRQNDLFTKKGMRFGRQIILKKQGKKSTYV